VEILYGDVDVEPRGATARRTRPAGKRPAALLIKSGRPATAKPVEIAVGSKMLNILASQPGSTRALMKTFGTALEQSRAIGRAVRFVVDVGPAGQSKITSVTSVTARPDAPASALPPARLAPWCQNEGKRHESESNTNTILDAVHRLHVLFRNLPGPRRHFGDGAVDDEGIRPE